MQPCGHVSCQLYLLLLQLPSVVPCINFLVRTFLCVKQKVDHRRYSKSQSSDSESDAVSVGPSGNVSCQLNLLLVQLPSVVSCIDFLCKKFPFCHTKSRPQNDSNSQFSDSKSDTLTVGPCGHVSSQLYLFRVQLPNVVPCIDFLCKKFPLCQTKSRPQRNSNPQSSDSKSDAVSVGPSGNVSCQLNLLLVQLPSVVSCIDFLCKKFPFCQTKSRPQNDLNSQFSDSESDTLTVGPCGHVSSQLYLLLLQLLGIVPCIDFVRTFFCAKQKVDHRGILTPNHLIEVRRVIRWP